PIFGVRWTIRNFMQAEGGIRDWSVTGVQACALPIWKCDKPADDQNVYYGAGGSGLGALRLATGEKLWAFKPPANGGALGAAPTRSEERRVGKEWRARQARHPEETWRAAVRGGDLRAD